MESATLARALGISALAGWTTLASGAVQPVPMRYVHNGPESPQDTRYLYHWKILETALEKTRAARGPYLLESAEPMTEQRQLAELERAAGNLTVMYQGTTRAMETALIPIRIPVDRNLVGYRVFLVRKERQPDFDRVRSLADLRRFTFGLGLGWLDVDVLRASGLPVVTGSSYEGLFEMLENRRFDAFVRGAVEVLDEFEERRAHIRDLAIEERLVLYYPMPMYFWFSRTDEGRRLAARAEDGMRRMIADGSYDRIFSEFQDRKIRRLDLAHRRIFKIDNPLVGPETPFADRRLWFNPATYRVRGR